MPVVNHAKDPRRRPRAVQDQQRPGEREVHRDQPEPAWNGIAGDRSSAAVVARYDAASIVVQRRAAPALSS
jgi:hypothetical protein